MHPLRLCVVVPCFVPLLSAQNGLHESRGVLAGAPAVVLVDGGLAAGADAQTRVHRSGFAAGPTVALPGANRPDLMVILQAHGAPPTLDVDDLSMGRDEVLLAGDGVVTVPPTSWAVLSFSLRQGATGIAGSRIQQEAALGSVGAALFTWLLPTPVLPTQLLMRTERSHSRQDLGLPAGVEVDAADFALLLGRDQAGLSALEPGFAALVGSEEIYFTVSHATRSQVPVAWWGNAPTANMSGATILRTVRPPTGGPWSQPHVWKVWYELGLTQNEDVDGLAVDVEGQKVLFSCVGTTRDQFLFVDLAADGVPVAPSVAKTANGTPVSQQVGKAQNDDVDAVCTLDPVIRTNGGLAVGGDDFGSSCGTPRTGLLGVPSVHASAFRRRSGATTFFDTWLSGWPPNTGITPGFAIPFVTFGNALDLVQLGPIQLRDTADPIPGNPRVQSLAIPATLCLSGQSITFRWAALDANVSELAEAWPVRVFL